MEELKKVCAALKERDIDFALLSSHENITYVSGFDAPVQIGAGNDFAGGFPLQLALIDANEECGRLIVADVNSKLASDQSRLGEPLVFSIFNHFSPLEAVLSYSDCVRGALYDAGLKNSHATVGVEFETLPSILFHLFLDEFKNLNIVSAQSVFESARWVKTAREIILLRRAAYIADLAQQVLLDFANNFNNNSEFEIWAKVQQKIMEGVSKVVPIVGELVTGPRTSVVAPGGPIQRKIEVGDMGIMDMGARVDGYWSDCSNVVVFGSEPNKEQKKYFKASKDGFEAAVEMLRPGVRCCDIEVAVGKAFKRNGFKITHYSGHQIGTTVNEKPRIVPYDRSIVESGMVFCFEPGVYSGPDGCIGARLEKMVLVTDSGAEILNKFPWGIEI